MKKVLLLAALIPQIILSCNGASVTSENRAIEEFDQFVSGVAGFISDEIKPLVSFIEQNNTSPVDYIMELFEKYDVVVLGERDHRDMTQYDLIQQIISDTRFIEQVGHILIEVGAYNMADELNAVLKGTYSDDDMFDKELVQVIFNMDFMPLWEKTNYTKLMKDVYLVNKNLPAEKKISVIPTEFPFSWRQAKTMTGDEFNTTVLDMWKYKDLIMANNAINELYKIFDGNSSRKKVLIIYNTPHSCRYFENNDIRYPYFAYQIIADRFPGRVANVMLNWAVVSNEEGYTSLSNDGKIDAAFAANGYKSIGFDLANTPFGDLLFDIENSLLISEIKMKDIYHGFIFYKPVLEWVIGIGVPNLDKIDDVKNELVRRAQVFDNMKGIRKIIHRTFFKNNEFRYYSTVRTFPMSVEFSEKKYNEQISRYYKP